MRVADSARNANYRDVTAVGAAALVAGLVVGVLRQQSGLYSLALTALASVAIGVLGAAHAAQRRSDGRGWRWLAVSGAAIYGLALVVSESVRDDTISERVLALTVSAVFGLPVGAWVLFRRAGPGRHFVEQRLGLSQLRAEMRSLSAAHAGLDRRDREIRALQRNLLQADEATRRALAREIHDAPLQRLIHAMRLADQASQPALREQIELAAGELREVAEALRPRAFDDLGLAGALRWLADEAQDRAPLAATCRTQGTLPTMDPVVEVALFRIAQEAVANAVRHANAAHVVIRSRYVGRWVLLEVRDDGRGFDPGEAHKGVGLLGVGERARAIGARWGIRSQPGETYVWVAWRALSSPDA